MGVVAAIRAVARSPRFGSQAASAWLAAEPELQRLGCDSPARQACLIGQCAHESGGFSRLHESLNYSAGRMMEVWPKRFPTWSSALPYARNPEALANKAYGPRADLGNRGEASGDGWRYRGRGYIQITGRYNYTAASEALGVDLVGDPERAADPETAWTVAAWFFAAKGLWRICDKIRGEGVHGDAFALLTHKINGGTHGLGDRRDRVSAALDLLQGEWSTLRLQTALAEHGFNPGPLDGLMGPRTRTALARAMARHGAVTREELQEIWEGAAS